METTKKSKYNSPDIAVIKLDNEISLVMMSNADPYHDPNESLQPDNNINPFK